MPKSVRSSEDKRALLRRECSAQERTTFGVRTSIRGKKVPAAMYYIICCFDFSFFFLENMHVMRGN